MSATIIPFPSKVASQTESLPYSCDIIKSEKRGFADVDACVPPGLAAKLMNMVAPCVDEVAFRHWSQGEPGGMVLLDVCVPEKIAADFRVIVANFQTAA
jgi:hypothetical protein